MDALRSVFEDFVAETLTGETAESSLIEPSYRKDPSMLMDTKAVVDS